MEKLQPLISVIIPVYNSEKYLPTALDSLVNQTYKNIEIIVINNGSSGNVGRIFEEYKKEHSEFKWKLLFLPENVGWFNAVVKGLNIMTGDYFTEMDSDDTISVEYYQQLLRTAIDKEADVVSAEYVHQIEDNTFVHCPMNDTELHDFTWENKEILTKYLEERGRNYNCCTMWSKLYAKSIWIDSEKYLAEINERITNCADVLISCILLGQARKWVNTHSVHYYHRVSSDSGTVRVTKTVAEMRFGFECTYWCFKYMKEYLIKKGRFEELKDYYDLFFKRYAALMFAPLLQNSSNLLSKKKLCNYGCKLFGIKEPVQLSVEDILFENRVSPFDDGLELSRKMILDQKIDIVSFDIFDTLIERPFLHSDDTFDFISIEYNKIKKSKKYIDFATYRRNAQKMTYEKIRKENPFVFEITLDEIYAELTDEGLVSPEEAAYLKEKEIELEYRFCKMRSIGKYLYDFAIRAGKKIICISDMYLDQKVIEKILIQNGYTQTFKIYVSSAEKVCKSDGRLFKRVISDLKVQPSRILHIGDNALSDFEVPQKLGMATIHISASRDILKGTCIGRYSGNSSLYIMGSDYNPINYTGYLGNRCVAGVVANKVFNNPFIQFNADSDFDANPNIVGYYLLGTYVFSVAKWLLKNARRGGYDTIHFFARDGLIFKRAYDILAENSDEKSPSSNYLHVSRKSLFPLMVKEKEDIYSIKNFYDIDAITPMGFIEMMRPVILDSVYENRETILLENHIVFDMPFDTDDKWIYFTKVYLENFFDKERIRKFQEKFSFHFSKMIGNHDCSFDVGYSARSEMLISETLGVNFDGFYLFYQRERAPIQAEKMGIKILSYHEGSIEYENIPAIEQIISSTEDGCYGYDFSGNTIKYLREKSEKGPETKFLMNLIHERAVEFVNDFVSTFKEWEKLPYRFESKALMYYIYHASIFDKGLLQGIALSDPLCRLSEDTDITLLWKTVPFVGPGASASAAGSINAIGVKGALVNYFKKHTPIWLRPFAKRVKRLLKW